MYSCTKQIIDDGVTKYFFPTGKYDYSQDKYDHRYTGFKPPQQGTPDNRTQIQKDLWTFYKSNIQNNVSTFSDDPATPPLTCPSIDDIQ